MTASRLSFCFYLRVGQHVPQRPGTDHSLQNKTHERGPNTTVHLGIHPKCQKNKNEFALCWSTSDGSMDYHNLAPEIVTLRKNSVRILFWTFRMDPKSHFSTLYAHLLRGWQRCCARWYPQARSRLGMASRRVAMGAVRIVACKPPPRHKKTENKGSLGGRAHTPAPSCRERWATRGPGSPTPSQPPPAEQ